MSIQIDRKKFIKDLLAGLAVSFTALSLGAAFGDMSGRGAIAGMLGAGIIPIITSLLGGTRIQASGPTAPMTAITALIVAKAHDNFPNTEMAEEFITMSIILSGLILVLMGLLKLGKYISLVPNAVVLGFMNGIAFLIWQDQISKFFGWNGKKILSGDTGLNILIALVTLVLIFFIPYAFKKFNILPKISHYISPILVTIILISFLAYILDFHVERIHIDAEKTGMAGLWYEIVRFFPSPTILKGEYILLAIPLAFQLCMLGYLDSLLTALVVDRMMKEKTDQNKELRAQGISNTFSGIIQGIPGAQATIRSVLLIKEDAQTRAAGVFVGVFVILCFIVFKSWVILIPSAVFAGVLFKAGWDVCDRDFVEAYIENSWFKNYNRNFQLAIITYTTAITLIVDLNVAVFTGSLLFYGLQKFLKKKNLTDVEPELEENID